MNKASFFALPVLFLCSYMLAVAQVSAGGAPYSFVYPNQVSAYVPVATLPAVDVAALLAEDALNDAKNQPYRFGAELKVQFTPDNAGLWETLPNGDRLWRLRIYGKQARTINLIFSRFYMPPGAKLHLYNGSKTDLIGAFTSANNKPHGQFATGLLRGDITTLEYYEPALVAGQGKIAISKAVYGYRGFFSPEKGFGDSGGCNNNVNCPEGADWQDQKRSVALIISGGFRACSGAMVNNINNDCTPYFLTANHCLDGSVNTWVFMFNYESPTCDNIDGPLNQTTSGCTLVANAPASDFALLLLSEVPPIDYNVYYAGWSAETTPGTSSVGIHHPAGDIKKITFNYDPLVSTEGLSGVADSHWEVTEWEDGTTEGGSSGSPLFDQNKHIVGQLHGGTASCSSITYDAYGKVSYSWNTGATASNRLRDWLDPGNTGTLVLDGRNCSEAVYSLDAGIAQITAPGSFLCNVSAITPQILVRNYGSTPLTALTIAYQINGGLIETLEWTGYLEFLSPAYISLPSISLPDGEHTLWVAVVQPNGIALDENILNDAATTTFTVTGGSDIAVQIVCDFWAEETSFTITNQQGQTFYTGGGFSAFQTYNLSYCLPMGCYIFTILDSYCDGMDPGASYAVALPDGTVAVQGGGNFGCSQAYNFCVESSALIATIDTAYLQPCNLPGVVQFYGGNDGATTYNWQFEGGFPETSTEQNPIIIYNQPGVYDVSLIVSNSLNTDTLMLTDYLTIYPALSLNGSITPAQTPNSTDGAIALLAEGAQSPYIYGWSNGATTPDIANLAPGQYCVTLTAANGCTATACYTVGTVVGLPHSATGGSTIALYPNPASDAAWLLLQMPQPGSFTASIYDLPGRLLQRFPLEATTSGSHTFELPLQNLPNGVYLLTVESKDRQVAGTVRLAIVR
ncbi:MAG TPA: T9SS type A sorting domain-containing protein [Chitinophagales bacterium]|mgnify:CR=1 FL=1|nr:T9SS type A sorting domain-containing protein [Chitinophagales bacterium]HRK29148.1 T9SS type A sorting domain-containing protein [Chitinophagales bacterium]